MTHRIDLTAIRLDTGNHEEDGRGCVMNWVARFAGEPVTDHPSCTSPVLTAFAIALNDGVDDEFRQRLIPFIPRLVGTAGDREADERRAWMATDWLVRTFTSTWLRRFGMAEDAAALEALPALTSTELAREAQPIIDEAKRKAYAARDAAGAAACDAAGDAACDAAGDAAWDAACDAAGDAAWDAARDAAWAAAGAAAGYAAGAAAGAAARDAAGAAARDAAWDAAGAAYEKAKKDRYDAAYNAARAVMDEALAATVSELRESALVLFSDMIDVRSAVPAHIAMAHKDVPMDVVAARRPARRPYVPNGEQLADRVVAPKHTPAAPAADPSGPGAATLAELPITAAASVSGLSFADLAETNAARVARWHGVNWRFADRDRTASHLGLAADDEWTGADWSNAMQGESGEAGNLVKKLRRIELSLPGNRKPGDLSRDDLIARLGAELADTIIYADLLAGYYGIDLGAAIVAKFNQISDELGLPEHLPDGEA